MAELDALQLNYHSYGGFDTYTDNFTTLCLRLEDAKAGLSDIMKKTKFISQIHDRDYGPILSRARTTPEWNFEKTVAMIRSEAKAMGKLKKNNPRNNNQSKNNRSNHQNGNRRNNNNRGNSHHNHHRKNNQQNWTNNDNKSDNDGMGHPPNLWNQLQGPQKKAYLEGRKALRNADPHRQREEIGKQYSKNNDQKTKRESNNAVTNVNNANNQSKDDENGNTDRSGNAASRGTDSNDGWSIVTPRQPRTIRFSNQFNRARLVKNRVNASSTRFLTTTMMK